MAFDPLTLTDLGADQIVTEATMLALYNNPKEIAQRGVGAPVVQVPQKVYITGNTSGVWNIPDGVTAFNVSIVGHGGQYLIPSTASSVTYDGVTISATGGSGNSGLNSSAGGMGSGGDLNLQGRRGYSNNAEVFGGAPPLGFGQPGVLSFAGQGISFGSTGYGAGVPGTFSGNLTHGGGGGFTTKRFTRVPGLDTVDYTVASPGAIPALIIIEY